MSFGHPVGQRDGEVAHQGLSGLREHLVIMDLHSGPTPVGGSGDETVGGVAGPIDTRVVIETIVEPVLVLVTERR